MIGAIIILLVTVAVGIVLYVYDLKWRREHPEEAGMKEADPEGANGQKTGGENMAGSHGEICCGRHIECEKSLVPEPGEKIIYYDDEELDRFAGRAPDDYTPEEEEEIRDVLLTLMAQDIPGWARSIQLRGISLPPAIRDELFILLDDCR